MSGGFTKAGQPQTGDFHAPIVGDGGQSAAANEKDNTEGQSGSSGGSQGGGEPNTGGAAASDNTGASSAAAGNDGGGQANADDLPELSDDQLAKVLSKRGVNASIDEIKSKLQPETPGETEEQKKAREALFEKRMLDHFIDNGGTIESFASLKEIASADLTKLSEAHIRRELIDGGFSEEDVNAILVERYYQINPEDVVKRDEETDEEFTARKEAVKKKVEYGTKRFTSIGENIQKQAKDALEKLRTAIKTSDLIAEKESEFSSTVDEVAKKLPRKEVFQLGKIDDIEIAPVEFNTSEDAITKAAQLLKDPVSRNQFFYKDNQLNVENIMSILVKNYQLEESLKRVYLEGSKRQVDEFEKVFPGLKASDVGVGGNNAGSKGAVKGKITGAGKPQVAGSPQIM